VALARVNLDRANFSAAESALERALAMDNRYAPALVQLARLSILRKQAREGLQLCDSALQNDAFSADGHYWRGRGLGLLDDWKDAALAFREAIEIGGADAMRTRWLAVALRATGRLDESEAVLQEALRRWPGDLELRSALVVTIFERGDVTRARELLHGMLADKPDHVPAIAAMAFVLDAEGNLQAAQTYAREALQRDPDNISAHHNLGLTLLKLGRYEEGWQHYEWRKELEQFAAAYLRFPFPEWTGENLAGKAVLVYAEQGLGDEIMFASCLPELLRRGAKVFIECEPRLGELFERSFPACTVFARVRTQANAWVKSLDPQPDWQIPIASLGRHFRRDRSDFPPHSGYLRADPAKLERWRSWLKALGPGVKIGLSWRGGLAKTGRERRSLELAEVESLLKMDGVRFVSLQYGRVSDELARLERLRGIHVPHIQEAIDDYDECAGLIGALDCVVSVCTSVVHLTGALGRPALVLAPYSPEWRYGFAGDTMPWYPSVKVFRQSRQGEWGPVLTAVRAQLLARAERA
jgi:tetratricopeptide (TPR) repeat protein